jgi:hypothetical protein
MAGALTVNDIGAHLLNNNGERAAEPETWTTIGRLISDIRCKGKVLHLPFLRFLINQPAGKIPTAGNISSESELICNQLSFGSCH